MGALLQTQQEAELLSPEMGVMGDSVHPFHAYTGGEIAAPHRRVLDKFSAALVPTNPRFLDTRRQSLARKIECQVQTSPYIAHCVEAGTAKGS